MDKFAGMLQKLKHVEVVKDKCDVNVELKKNTSAELASQITIID